MRTRVIAAAAAPLLIAGCAPASAALHGYHRYTNSSASMEPTLRPGQTFNARVVRRGRYEPRRGDIVVFTRANWAAPGPGHNTYVKRVVAIGGDRIGCCSGGRVTLNGRPLDEPYLAPDTPEMSFATVTVPPGHVWLMGDNRPVSADSRIGGRGAVPASAVVGVAVLK
jgi:signal peptidase I